MEKNYIIKRDGSQEPISFDKVLYRIKNMCALPGEKKLKENFTPLKNVDYNKIAQETIAGIYPGVHTSELDDLTVNNLQPLATIHPDYETLASRILVSNFHKNGIVNLQTHFNWANFSEKDVKTLKINMEEIKNIEKHLYKYVAIALYNNKDVNNQQCPLIAPHILNLIINNAERIEKLLDYSQDYCFDSAGFKLMEELYLQKALLITNDGNKRIAIERPQHMFMRVALGIHFSSEYTDYNNLRCDNNAVFKEVEPILKKYLPNSKLLDIQLSNKVCWKEVIQIIEDQYSENNDIKQVKTIIAKHTISWNELLATLKNDGDNWQEVEETYKFLSQKLFTHATPTLFNSGTLKPQNSSCFLGQLGFDSMDAITKYWSMLATISKWAGGLGTHVHNVRPKGSYIRGTNGVSNGLVPMLKVVNDISVYVDQCFHPETYVWTKTGAKKIAAVQITDKLLTHDGSWQPVAEVRQYSVSSAEMVKIWVNYSFNPITVTVKHPLYVIDKNFTNGWKRYVEAGELTPENIFIIPVPKYIKDYNYTEDDCYVYGLLLGSGIIDWNKYFMLDLARNTRLEEYLTAHAIEFTYDTVYKWQKNPHIPIQANMIYYDEKNKYICPAMLNLPVAKTLQILAGLSDGTNKKSNEISTPSKLLAENICYLLLRLHTLPTCSMDNDNYVINYHINSFNKPEILYGTITKIEKYEYSGVLTDFEMQNNHNYSVHGCHAHNGGNKRPGSHAIYIEPWHGDIFDVVSLKKARGNEAMRAKNLQYAMWLSDEFMRTIKREKDLYPDLLNDAELNLSEVEEKNNDPYGGAKGLWYLMNPDQSANLSNYYDAEYRADWIPDEELFDPARQAEMLDKYKFTYTYRSYIREKKYVEKVSACYLWKHICEVIIETGVPYMCFKDSGNRKSNQKNLGTIKSSNLCTEIYQYSSSQELAVCNLASIVLTAFVCDAMSQTKWRIVEIKDQYETNIQSLISDKYQPMPKYINWNLLEKVVRRCVRNLNRVIDTNFYPVSEAKFSNMKHRPMSIGVQDLANLFTVLRLPFDSEAANQLTFYLHEFMYYIACDESAELAAVEGAYESFHGSPASQGILQPDFWQLKYPLSLDWNALRTKIKKTGMRNSLLIGLMPTGSTSTIFGSSPCFEPHNALIYKRRNRIKEFTMVNKYLINDLMSIGVWNKSVLDEILQSRKGSIMDCTRVPLAIRNIYKNAWDISSKETSNKCIIRSPFIDQGQSYSVFIEKPTIKILSQLHFYNWTNGLKTSSYYTRRLPSLDPKKLQITSEKTEKTEKKDNDEEPKPCPWRPGMKGNCVTCES